MDCKTDREAQLEKALEEIESSLDSDCVGPTQRAKYVRNIIDRVLDREKPPKAMSQIDFDRIKCRYATIMASKDNSLLYSELVNLINEVERLRSIINTSSGDNIWVTFGAEPEKVKVNGCVVINVTRKYGAIHLIPLSDIVGSVISERKVANEGI